MITIKDLNNYSRISNELDTLCSKYAEKYLEYWEYYDGWKILEDNLIEISYWFYSDMDPYYGTDKEHETLLIPFDKFIKQCKELL